jgi:predicted MFS family arabinose efflux permease
VLMSTLGMGSWLALAFSSGHYYPVLLLVMACASTLAFCDVMADALMVETGRPLGLTGSFQAMQWASISLAFAVAQLGGGYLAARAAPHTVFLLSACFPLATLLATLLAVRDPKTKINSADLHDTSNALRATVRSPTLWVVVGFLFLWNFSPSLGTPLLYYQVDVLGFSKVFIGTLGALSNVAGMGGALVFLLYYRAIRLDRLLYLTVTLGVASTLGFIGLIGPKSAVVIFVAFGAISQVTHLAVLDLAARSCPPHAEGTVFALLMSTLNLGRMASTACGGWLYEQVGFSWLVVVSAGFTAMCWLIVPYLYTEPGGVVDQ